MFVEYKEQGEAVPVKVGTLKPSEAIRRGHTMIEENRECYLDCGKGCALGAMWVGMGRTEDEWARLEYSSKNPMTQEFARYVGISADLAMQISHRHYQGAPRLRIADWLESQGL